MSQPIKALCVFCGSSLGADSVYKEAAQELGGEIARRGMRLVYGAGNIGLMGVIADAVLDAGGEVVGVIPEALLKKEVAHQSLTELIVVETMHQRKAKMAELADAFVAMPGGFGTFEEFCEVLTWNQLGVHDKPCGLLNVAGYYDSLLALFQRAENDRFLRLEHHQMVLTADSVSDLFVCLANWQPTPQNKWIDRDET
ncbi:LOG family protein [Thalassoroseus pseudoceratinae]|uniref:LOG family protein n=1 Tax=Thalassoroseus pseudoceratinae TaxID=2713176 RepID=UPI00142125FC|nr:TIGR00730 family Rossman fold protein [Thalassoroseus pseudoceratinae]